MLQGPLSRDIGSYPDGLVLPVDKPYRWTSADLVRKVKYAAIRHFGKKNLKVGHAGTLDPLATGLVLVCIGAATRRAQALQDSDKEYVAGIAFGATTPSYDLEKEPDRFFPTDGIDAASVKAALAGFIGPQEQVAPLFSAKSVDGTRAYEMARKLYKSDPSSLDEAAMSLLRPNMISISELELLGFFPDGVQEETGGRGAKSGASGRINVSDGVAGLPLAVVRMVCSKGTYVRAFARDLGERLGSGAHLRSLRRTRTGGYTDEDALSLRDALSLFTV